MREALAFLLAASAGFSPASAPESACSLEDVSVTWGFKESFRSYISGAIAKGSWEVSGDVGYATPSFEFTGGTGHVMPDRTEAELSFTGDIVFRGHDGILETSLADPVILVEESRTAVVIVDVTGDTMDEVSVSERGVVFARVSWSSDDETVDSEAGRWMVRDAEVTLTEEGSAAFGTYPAGELMDPLSWDISVAPGCLEEPSRSIGWVPGAFVAATLGASAIALAIRRGRK